MMTTPERAFAGCIVTLVNLDTGEQRVEHAAGYHYQSTEWLPPEVSGRRDLSQEPARMLAQLRGRTLGDGSRSIRHPRKRSRQTHTVNVLDALRLLLNEVDRWEGTWRVRTISTPQTILADIRGRGFGVEDGSRKIATVEQTMLGKIRRLDMAENA